MSITGMLQKSVHPLNWNTRDKKQLSIVHERIALETL